MFLDRYSNREPRSADSVSSITGCRVGARNRGSQRGCGGGIFSDRGNSLPGGIRDTCPLRTVNSRQDWPMARGSAQLTFKTLRHVSNPFCFLSARSWQLRQRLEPLGIQHRLRCTQGSHPTYQYTRHRALRLALPTARGRRSAPTTGVAPFRRRNGRWCPGKRGRRGPGG